MDLSLIFVQGMQGPVSKGEGIQLDNECLLRYNAFNGHLENVKYLVEIGACLHTEDDYALRWAAANGHLEVVKYLVNQGADIRAENNQAMRYSAELGHLEVVKYLVSQGADIHTNEFNNTLLVVVQNGHLEILKYLLSLGLKNEYLILCAAHNGQLEVLKYLLSLEYSCNNTENENALVFAAKQEHLLVIEYLVNLGVDVRIVINKFPYLKNILKKYIKTELYNGLLNEKTETDCGICLTEMKSEIIQCNVCKKCVHKQCHDTWGGNCVYCRN